MRIAIDLWVGCGEHFQLPHELVKLLTLNGRITLNQVTNNTSTSIWAQGWMKAHQLNLQNDFVEPMA